MGVVYECHMELRQQNNGCNVGEPPSPPISSDDMLPSHSAHGIWIHTHTFATGQNKHIGRRVENPQSNVAECNVKKYSFLLTQCYYSHPFCSQKAASRRLDGSLVL